MEDLRQAKSTQFVTLTPVEIIGEQQTLLAPVTVNVNRIMVVRSMGDDYKYKFREHSGDFHATASLEVGTFRAGTQLSGSPAKEGGSASIIHWWLTEEEYLRITSVVEGEA